MIKEQRLQKLNKLQNKIFNFKNSNKELVNKWNDIDCSISYLEVLGDCFLIDRFFIGLVRNKITCSELIDEVDNEKFKVICIKIDYITNMIRLAKRNKLKINCIQQNKDKFFKTWKTYIGEVENEKN